MNRLRRYLEWFCIGIGVMVLLMPKVNGEVKSSKKLQYVTLGRPGGLTMNRISFVMGQKKGFYEKEGIDLEIITLTHKALVPGLISGNLDFEGGATTSIAAAGAGIPLKVLFVGATRRPTYLVGKPGIKTVKDLKGKTVGVNSLGDSEHGAARMALKELGFDPDKDLTFVAIGPGIKVAALVTGSVDVVFASIGNRLTLVKRGFSSILRVSDIAGTLSQGLGTSVRKLQSSPIMMKKVIKATLMGHTYAKEHRDEIIDFMVKEWGNDRDVSIGEYDENIRYFTKDGTVPDKLILGVLEMAKSSGLQVKPGITVNDLADFSLLREVHKEMGLAS